MQYKLEILQSSAATSAKRDGKPLFAGVAGDYDQ